MSHSDGLLRVFLKCLSHELGNYLSPATMLVEGLADELEGEVAEDARDLVLSVRAVSELLSVLRALSLVLESSSSQDDQRAALLQFSLSIKSSFPDSEAVSTLGDKLERVLNPQQKE